MQNIMKIGLTLNKTTCIFLISEKHYKTFFSFINIKTHNIHAWDHQFSPTGKLSDGKEEIKDWSLLADRSL